MSYDHETLLYSSYGNYYFATFFSSFFEKKEIKLIGKVKKNREFEQKCLAKLYNETVELSSVF